MRWILSLFLGLVLFVPVVGFAQAPSTKEVRATIEVLEHFEQTETATAYRFIARGVDDKVYTVDSADGFIEDVGVRLREGQRVILQVVQTPDEQVVFFIDIVRVPRLLWIVALFAVVVIAVGGVFGVRAVVGFGVTVGLIFGLFIPQLLRGSDPLLWAVISAVLIAVVNVFLTHGMNRESRLATLVTIGGILLAVVVSALFVGFTQLSGLGTDEASKLFLSDVLFGASSRGLLLAGILLGTVGVLDDVVVTQIETVSELRSTNVKLPAKELYQRAMRIGRHHIASVVNTLILAYVGAALPLFILFYQLDSLTIWRFMNEGVVAEELVRTLAGTTVLVLMVPIATAAAAWGMKKDRA